MIERARVIKGRFGTETETRPQSGAANDARRIPAEVMDARDEAARILRKAKAEATTMLADARAQVATIADAAAREAREKELAKVAAELVVFRATEEKKAERELERIVEMARLLAERLIGEGLRIEPERIAGLAHEALRETRGARRLRLEASPEDAPVLARVLDETGVAVAEIIASPELGRGSLVVHTELGRIDARLDAVLERLAETLREALR